MSVYLAARCCCRWPNTWKHDGARSELQGECSNTSKCFCAKWLLYLAFQTALTREGSSVSQWLAMGWMTGLPPHKQRRVYLTNSMERRPSWKANSSLASQEIPRIFWNLHVHYCAHKSPPLVPILSQINTVYDHQSHFAFHCQTQAGCISVEASYSVNSKHLSTFNHESPLQTTLWNLRNTVKKVSFISH